MTSHSPLHIKILSLSDPERYAVRRLVIAAHEELLKKRPEFEIQIQEINQATEIGKYAQVLVLPTLVMNEKVVCSGRFPTRQEILHWLEERST